MENKPTISFARAAILAVSYMLSRVALMIPWLIPVNQLSFEGKAAVHFGLTALIYILFVIPERLLRCDQFNRMANAARPSYRLGQMYRVGMQRLLRVSPFLLPALFVIGLIYYILFSNMKAMSILKDIGAVFGSATGYDAGLAILLIAGFLFILLSAVFWHRDAPADYLGSFPVFRQVKKNPEKKRILKKASRKNCLLGLPAYVLWIGVTVYMGLRQDVGGGSLLSQVTNILYRVIPGIFGNREYWMYMGLILVFLYLPLWVLRKWTVAKACADAT
ncbi:MAG: hypothetical protein IJ240_07985 [Clostridia bacterium]|nr:hypothetical protein [Clostridia bacterium]